MIKKQKKIGEILIEKGLISPQQLTEALEEQKRTKDFLGAILIRRGAVEEEDFLKALSVQYNIPFKKIKYNYIKLDFVSKFGSSLLLEHKCFPIEADEDTITMAITNPLDMWAMKKCEEAARGLFLRFVLVTARDMEEVIRRYGEYMRGKNL